MSVSSFKILTPWHRHWRGGYSLLVTSVVILLFVRLVHYGVQSFFGQSLSDAGLFVFLSSNLILLVWQLGGSLKAIDHSMSYSGDMVAVYFCYLSIVLVFVMSLLQAGDSLSSFHTPVSVEDPVNIIAPQLPLSAGGESVLVRGFIDFNTSSMLQARIADNTQVKTVLLDSEGGRVFAARAMSIIVERAGLDTHVEGNCYSACALVFLSGEQRSMGINARLGFHRYSMGAVQPGKVLSIEAEMEKDRRYFLSRDVDAGFVQRMFERQSDELWVPNRKELEQAGVLTKKTVKPKN